MNETTRSRARGTMLGLAVGDALGTTLEFKTPHAPPFPARLTGPHRDIIGGGPFRVAPGEVTDDTQMACCIAASINRHRAFDAHDVVQRYVDWHRKAFDVGAQTRAALGWAVTAPLEGGRVVWERGTDERKPAGNGSLMRTAPIGVYFGDQQARIAAGWSDSSLTHYDPRCLFACIAFNGAIAAGIRGEPVSGMMEAAVRDLEIAVALNVQPSSPNRAELLKGAADVTEDLRLAEQDNPDLDGVAHEHTLDLLTQAGFVRVAFRLAFWELRHAPSFESALIDVVNRGGDADINGAIVGALLGARHGETAIPKAWRQAVLNAVGLRPEYHPNVLLKMVATLVNS